MGSRTLPEITVWEHSSQSPQQTQVKALSWKVATYEHDLETLLSSQDQSSLKMGRGKIENRSEVRWIKVWNCFWNYECCIFQTKEEREHLACHQQSVQKPESLMAEDALVSNYLTACIFGKAVSILQGICNISFPKMILLGYALQCLPKPNWTILQSYKVTSTDRGLQRTTFNLWCRINVRNVLWIVPSQFFHCWNFN